MEIDLRVTKDKKLSESLRRFANGLRINKSANRDGAMSLVTETRSKIQGDIDNLIEGLKEPDKKVKTE